MPRSHILIKKDIHIKQLKHEQFLLLKQLKETRRKYNRTQEYIGFMLGVSRNTIGKWENRKSKPRFFTTFKIPGLIRFLQVEKKEPY